MIHLLEVYFKCECGEPVLAMIHKHESEDMAICLECGRRYKVYKPKIEEIKE
jgi:transcription elongation factor Elf1